MPRAVSLTAAARRSQPLALPQHALAACVRSVGQVSRPGVTIGQLEMHPQSLSPPPEPTSWSRGSPPENLAPSTHPVPCPPSTPLILCPVPSPHVSPPVVQRAPSACPFPVLLPYTSPPVAPPPPPPAQGPLGPHKRMPRPLLSTLPCLWRGASAVEQPLPRRGVARLYPSTFLPCLPAQEEGYCTTSQVHTPQVVSP